ncbi:MAG: hypothetical protein MJ252_17640, partial [archaeon]|nr:hypothetical protein [archaeon]
MGSGYGLKSDQTEENHLILCSVPVEDVEFEKESEILSVPSKRSSFFGNFSTVFPKSCLNPEISTEKKKKIIWLTDNEFSKENEDILKQNKEILQKFDLERISSASELLPSLEKSFFDLVFVIVDDYLFEDWTKEYLNIFSKLKCLCASRILLRKNLPVSENKYYKDNFVNPGDANSDFKEVINYFNASEQKLMEEIFENENGGSVLETFRFSETGKDFFLCKIDSLEDLTIPIIIPKAFTRRLFTKDDLINFRKYISTFKDESLHQLVKPSLDKKIKEPLQILSKYFLYMFCLKTEFYQKVKEHLKYSDNLKFYKGFLSLLYYAIGKKVLKVCRDRQLFCGLQIANEDLEEMEKIFNEKEERKEELENQEEDDQRHLEGGKVNAAIFCSRNFLNFSKSEEVSEKKLKALIPKQNETKVKLILNPLNKSDTFLPSNIDLDSEGISPFKEEKEVLILPLSFFDIESIEEQTEENGEIIKVITLSYLNAYDQILNNHLDSLKVAKNENGLMNFKEEIAKGKLTQEIKNLFSEEEFPSAMDCLNEVIHQKFQRQKRKTEDLPEYPYDPNDEKEKEAESLSKKEKMVRTQVLWITNREEEETNSLPGFKNLKEDEGKELLKVKSPLEAYEKLSKGKNFSFTLVYVIVDDSQFDDWASIYSDECCDLRCLCCTLILLTKEENLPSVKKNPFFGNALVNPGKAVKDFKEALTYINKDECDFKNAFIYKQKPFNFVGKGYGFCMKRITTLEELSPNVLFIKSVNPEIFPEDYLLKFRNFLYSYENEGIKNLAKPSSEKNMKVPPEILAKYYAKLYTLETLFYKDLNRNLTYDENLKHYRGFISLLYYALAKGVLHCSKSDMLFRGTQISSEEFKQIKEIFNEKKEGEKEGKSSEKGTKINAAIYCLKNFFSFSKKKEVAEEFLQRSIRKTHKNKEENKSDLVYVKFILHPAESNDKFIAANIDLNKDGLSAMPKEEEVLFLPFSCFDIVDVREEELKVDLNPKRKLKKTIKKKPKEDLKKDLKEENKEMTVKEKLFVIELNYLADYEKKIDDHLQNLQKEGKVEEIQEFNKKANEGEMNKEITECICESKEEMEKIQKQAEEIIQKKAANEEKSLEEQREMERKNA